MRDKAKPDIMSVDTVCANSIYTGTIGVLYDSASDRWIHIMRRETFFPVLSTGSKVWWTTFFEICVIGSLHPNLKMALSWQIQKEKSTIHLIMANAIKGHWLAQFCCVGIQSFFKVVRIGKCQEFPNEPLWGKYISRVALFAKDIEQDALFYSKCFRSFIWHPNMNT